MKDEIIKDYGPNAFISEFVSGGPKNYAYKVKSEGSDDEKIVCKVKGIRLNYMNSLKINFDSIKQLLFNTYDNDKPTIAQQNNMILREQNNIVYSMYLQI